MPCPLRRGEQCSRFASCLRTACGHQCRWRWRTIERPCRLRPAEGYTELRTNDTAVFSERALFAFERDVGGKRLLAKFAKPVNIFGMENALPKLVVHNIVQG